MSTESMHVNQLKRYKFPVFSRNTGDITWRSERITFEWHGAPLSLANGLRRALISDIPTRVLGEFTFFDFHVPNATSYIDQTRARPVMHNEQLRLRLELVPISQRAEHADVVVYLGTRDAPFQVPSEHTGLWRDVTTDDLVVRSGDTTIPTRDFFPNTVLITQLKKGQRVAFECRPVEGRGRTHSRHTPVCSASYAYLPSSPDYAADFHWTHEADYAREFDNYPAGFLFEVHALPYWTPEETTIRGLDALHETCRGTFARVLATVPEVLQTDEGKTSVFFRLENEGHTVFQLIQEYLLRRLAGLGELDAYVAYVVVHPKENVLHFRVTSAHVFVQPDNTLPAHNVITDAFYDILADIDRAKFLIKSLFESEGRA